MDMKNALQVFEYSSFPGRKEVVEEDFRNRFNQLRTAKSMSSTEEDKARYQGKVADLISARDALFDQFRREALLEANEATGKSKSQPEPKNASSEVRDSQAVVHEQTANSKEMSDFDFFLTVFAIGLPAAALVLLIVAILKRLFG